MTKPKKTEVPIGLVDEELRQLHNDAMGTGNPRVMRSIQAMADKLRGAGVTDMFAPGEPGEAIGGGEIDEDAKLPDGPLDERDNKGEKIKKR